MKIALTSLLGLICLASSACRKTPEKQVEHHEISEEESNRAIQKAFVEQSPETLKEVPAGVEKFFTILGRATRSSADFDLDRFVTIDGMISSLESSGALDSLTSSQKKDFEAGVRVGVSNLGNAFRRIAFDQHRIQLVEKIGENEVLVYVQLYDNELGVVNQMRWWLVETDAGWRTYDYEDLSMGLRTVKLMGTLLRSGLVGEKDSWVQKFVAVSKQVQQLDPRDPDTYTKIKQPLADLRMHELPVDIKAFATLMMVAVLQMEGDPEAALAELDAARDGKYSGPLVDYQRGSTLAMLDRHEEALKSYQQHMGRFGADSDILELTADSYFALGQLDKAKENAAAGLADNPGSLGCLLTLAAASDPEEISHPEFAKRFKKFPETEATYEVTLDFLLQEQHRQKARTLFGVFQKEFPDSELIGYYQEEFAKED